MKKVALWLAAALLVAGIIAAWPTESRSQQYQPPPQFRSKLLSCQWQGVFDAAARVTCGVQNMDSNRAAYGIVSATVTRTSNSAVLNRQEQVFLRPAEGTAKTFVFREVRSTDQGVRCLCNAWATAVVNPVR